MPSVVISGFNKEIQICSYGTSSHGNLLNHISMYLLQITYMA